MATTEEKEKYVLDSIIALRTPGKSKGIHVRLSGFNDAFRGKFGEDPRAFTEMMAAKGKIVIQPRKAGAMLYLPGDEPLPPVTGAEAQARIEAFQASKQ